MSQNVVSTATLPPPDEGSNKIVMSPAIKALIECHVRDAKTFDHAAYKIEADAAANRNTVKPYSVSANTQAYTYRQLAQGEMAALVGLLRHQLPHASLEGRYDWVKQNIPLHTDDLIRIWNALLAGY